MPPVPRPTSSVRAYRNARLYRPLARVLREYNRRLLQGLHAMGYTDFQPAFPSMLSNLDLAGTPVTVLAQRAGVTRQAAGQLLREIERCGYVRRTSDENDRRVIVVRFSPRGKRLLAAVFRMVEQIEADFQSHLQTDQFDQVRTQLHLLADAIDPGGAFGQGDVDA